MPSGDTSAELSRGLLQPEADSRTSGTIRFRRLDTASDPEVALLTDVLRAGSAIHDPARLAAHFGAWYGRQRAYGRFLSVSRRGLPNDEWKITRTRLHPEHGSVPVEPADPWRDWERLPSGRGGFLSEVMRLEEPQILVDLDLEGDSLLSVMMPGMRSCIALPNYDQGKALNWSLFFSPDPEGWTLEQLRQATLDSNLLGSVTRGLVARRQVDELNTRLRGQLEQIASIQRDLLPKRVPAIPGLDIATSYLTSEQAGGDYYDFLQIPGAERVPRWGIMVADVAGHGAGAATVMAMLRAILHCADASHCSPRRVLEYVNAKLHALDLTGSFATAFFAVFDPTTGELRWARAGHNPPRLKRGTDGRIEVLDGDGGLPLGVSDDPLLGEQSVRLRAGDTVVMYTDGVTEAFNADRQQFGEKRFDEALEHCSGEPGCVVDSIHGALHRHTGKLGRDDDQTLVVLKFRGLGWKPGA